MRKITHPAHALPELFVKFIKQYHYLNRKIPLCKQIYNLENVHKINLKVSISLMELNFPKYQIPHLFF